MKITLCVCASLLTAFLLRAADTSGSLTIPDEIGMYTKAPNGTWQEIDPDILNWKTGGVLKSIFSEGIVRPDVNARIRQKSAFLDAAFEDEFLVVVPDGVSITEFQMLRLHQHSNSREFRLITGGVFHQSGGADRDEMEFKHTKIAPHAYLVSFDRYEGGGEYGFLPPPSFTQTPVYMGKIYCFRMKN
ncbi:MAG: hypothetical protein JOY62_17575 [Acidobacteriaceae bacterium]|nr:hypothetical protein [Acidobacteriaceae bacterium]MBV9781777.1 hypothetical protein [Acidobacteriaceae bacterium]